MHGNVWEWTQDVSKAYEKGEDSKATEDIEGFEGINRIFKRDGCVVRGGSFLNSKSLVRSASRDVAIRTVLLSNVGFRPARTFR
jgi:formylglycine-generating enzyme required for sulfatase activity